MPCMEEDEVTSEQKSLLDCDRCLSKRRVLRPDLKAYIVINETNKEMY